MGAVGGSEDPPVRRGYWRWPLDGAHSLVRDEGAAAEVLLVDEERRHPREGVRGGLLAAHDLGVGARQAALAVQAGGKLVIYEARESIFLRGCEIIGKSHYYG